jgi:hypothetical protein
MPARGNKASVGPSELPDGIAVHAGPNHAVYEEDLTIFGNFQIFKYFSPASC